MKNIIKPDYISLVTQQISIGFSETGVIFSTGTAFFYQYKSKKYLITNWHNVTGRNPVTGKPLSKNHSGIPDSFTTYYRWKDVNKGAQIQEIKLYEDIELIKPKWLIHPVYRENVDVVAIEVEVDEKFFFAPINEEDFDDIEPSVGDECFVIGYPFSDFRYLGLPIWKKASIATEPTVNEDQLPKILIDTATRPGLSGSPVIVQSTGVHNLTMEGMFKDDSIIGRIRGFLGIYSGRIGKGEIQAQLGIVWKKKVINEIIEGQEKGDIKFQSK